MKGKNNPLISNSEVIVFKPEKGQTEFQVILDGAHDTVWATEQQIMDLFGKARRTIGAHIQNIYDEGELDKNSTWREFRQVQKEGSREVTRKIAAYNLDVIISVGYRVKSAVGTEFRKWATKKLKEHLIVGYTINKELLKNEKKK
ncbi:MAG: virulence RhuM family protein [Flavobacteriaceae bacterium]|nr:virulence RhuM family protein [Flavobacteriaceae bacterium]